MSEEQRTRSVILICTILIVAFQLITHAYSVFQLKQYHDEARDCFLRGE